jgi:hypothetical protein
MIWSHLTAVVTKPGYLPKDKKEIDPLKIGKNSSFWEILMVREELYAELLVRKKQRQGQLVLPQTSINTSEDSSSANELKEPMLKEAEVEHAREAEIRRLVL